MSADVLNVVLLSKWLPAKRRQRIATWVVLFIVFWRSDSVIEMCFAFVVVGWALCVLIDGVVEEVVA